MLCQLDGPRVGTDQPLTFAGRSPADKTSTASVPVVCSGIVQGGSYTLSLGAGTYGVGDGISTRYLNNMTNGGAFMAYNIYTVPSYGTVWGNGATGCITDRADFRLAAATNRNPCTARCQPDRTRSKPVATATRSR